MTEKEWLRTDNLEWAVEELVCDRLAPDRKFRLYACACCRRIIHLLDGTEYVNLLITAERYADRKGQKSSLLAQVGELRRVLGEVSVSDAADDPTAAAREAVMRTADFAESYKREYYSHHDTCPYPSWSAAYARYAVAGQAYKKGHMLEREQLHLLRDIFGNPFRPITLFSGMAHRYRRCPRAADV